MYRHRLWGLSPTASLCLCLTFPSASQHPLHRRWGRKAQGGCSQVFPFPRWVRLWWNSFLCGQGLLKEQSAWGVFQNSSFSPPSSGNIPGFFSDIHHEGLAGLLEVKLTEVWGPPPPMGWVLLEFSALILVQHFVNYSSGFPTWALVPVEASAQLRRDSLYLPVCLSKFWVSGLPYGLSSLKDLKTVVDFQFFAYGNDNNFQIPYMLGQRLAVSHYMWIRFIWTALWYTLVYNNFCPVDGNFSCSQLCSVINNAVMSVFLHVSLGTYRQVSPRQILEVKLLNCNNWYLSSTWLWSELVSKVVVPLYTPCSREFL